MPGRLVYIVDDDDDVRDSTTVLLEAAGIKAVAFASGGEFLKDYKAATGTCILLDLNMPGMSGLQVLDALRESRNTIPVILISGRADPMSDETAVRSGAIALLHKPLASSELIALVRRLFTE